MSMSALKQFYDHVSCSPELKARATQSLADSPASLVLLAKLEGFDFSEGELVKALADNAALEEGELSDADLDVVAGGTVSTIQKPSSSLSSPVPRS
ncbi:putative ribosomally synthesized peptide with nif11-like leader [Agrobacterium vitis]|nr:putative ribosomally synthesized peptide with nif11-like leader [Agrobacterium vitis]MBE1439472.1 putative ribosomally synthesized peptide with nif11-like leader [Agrobacterium vitis]